MALQDAQLRAEIEKLRGRQMGTRRVPVAQRASDASLRRPNQTLSQDNKRLRGENAELKDELAALLGERRDAGPQTRGRRHSVRARPERSLLLASKRQRRGSRSRRLLVVQGR
ncbi:MAG: hypothetical protein LC790_18595 [Actinobacteria bacterium]|nr:hypothetical protein [Actinomycetota bacterium]